MRKRLQRIRDKLRKEIEMSEQRAIRPEDIRPDLPARVLELLARPQLDRSPGEPGRQGARAAARRSSPTSPSRSCRRSSTSRRPRDRSADDALYIDRHELQRVDERRILRYDLTLPLLLTVRYRRTAAADLRRRQGVSRVPARRHAPRGVPPGRGVLARRARAARSVADDGPRAPVGRRHAARPHGEDRADPIRDVQPGMGARSRRTTAAGSKCWRGASSPTRSSRTSAATRAIHTAIGVGYGLERLAMLRYGIDDIRKVDVTRVA